MKRNYKSIEVKEYFEKISSTKNAKVKDFNLLKETIIKELKSIINDTFFNEKNLKILEIKLMHESILEKILTVEKYCINENKKISITPIYIMKQISIKDQEDLIKA
ncbi:MAG: hypothetical protein RSF67_08035 [Clostridia bacterium]